MATENAPKTEIVIRDMTEGDISNITELAVEIMGGDTPKVYSSVIDSYVGGELGLSCVAEVRGQMVGYVLGRLTYAPPPFSTSACIQLIGIDSDLRHQGIAKRLLERFRQRCQDKGVEAMHISIHGKDKRVQKFLQRCGFHPSEWFRFSAKVKE